MHPLSSGKPSTPVPGLPVHFQQPLPATVWGRAVRNGGGGGAGVQMAPGCTPADGSSEFALACHHTRTLFIFLPSPQFREFIDGPGFNGSEKTSGGEFPHKSKTAISHHPAQDSSLFHRLALGTMWKRGQEGKSGVGGDDKGVPIPSSPTPILETQRPGWLMLARPLEGDFPESWHPAGQAKLQAWLPAYPQLSITHPQPGALAATRVSRH